MILEENRRRSSKPNVVLELYHAIEMIRKQRQIANLHRIVKFTDREYGLSAKECLINLHKAITDNLIVETVTIGCKGAKAGVEQEGYWIPEKENFINAIKEESHDWYCFDCHKPGEVVGCSACFRVYHKDCLPDVKAFNKFTCSWCKASSCSANAGDQETLALGKCLHFVVTQQKEHWKELSTAKDFPFYDYFVHSPYDLEKLQMDCHNCIFKCTEEFQAKALQIHHNCVVALGFDHALAKLAQQFIEDCSYELQELKLCRNCFYLSNTKPMKDWFCKPCDPPHQVVWAKQKGFEYWPAKIIQVEKDRVDVRFFGRHHPRAWIPIDAVRAISVSPTELKVKRKQQWKQASDEMKEYIRQCECVLGKDEASKIILYDSPYGIGKNSELVSAMEDRNDSVSSPQPGSAKSSPAKESKKNDSIEESPTVCMENESMKVTVLDESSPETKGPVALAKRTLDNDNESDAIPAKRIKLENSSPEKENAPSNLDSRENSILSELNTTDCGCKKRYESILMKFKDYVIESNRLDKSKLMRAAAIKSDFERDEATAKVTAEYEEKLKDLRESHEKELAEAKMQRWCQTCLVPATNPCCKNSSYCDECSKKVRPGSGDDCATPDTPTARGRRPKRSRS